MPPIFEIHIPLEDHGYTLPIMPLSLHQVPRVHKIQRIIDPPLILLRTMPSTHIHRKVVPRRIRSPESSRIIAPLSWIPARNWSCTRIRSWWGGTDDDGAFGIARVEVYCVGGAEEVDGRGFDGGGAVHKAPLVEEDELVAVEGGRGNEAGAGRDIGVDIFAFNDVRGYMFGVGHTLIQNVRRY